MKRHKVGIWYILFSWHVRMLGYTYSAFKAQDDVGSGLALRGLAVPLTPEILSGDTATKPGEETKAHLLEAEASGVINLCG